MRIRVVEVSIPAGEHVDLPKDSHLKRVTKYYKLQSSLLGWLWSDLTDPIYNMVYPIFDTLEEANDYIRRTYGERETVVAEYKIK